MCDYVPVELSTPVHKVVSLFYVLVMIALIACCILDLFKILTSQDEKTIRDKQNMLVRRIIAGVLIFFVPYIIQFIFSIINITEANESVRCARLIILGH